MLEENWNWIDEMNVGTLIIIVFFRSEGGEVIGDENAGDSAASDYCATAFQPGPSRCHRRTNRPSPNLRKVKRFVLSLSARSSPGGGFFLNQRCSSLSTALFYHLSVDSPLLTPSRVCRRPLEHDVAVTPMLHGKPTRATPVFTVLIL